MTPVWWLWIPITLFASGAQTIRNATQRHIQDEIGTMGATFIRFAFAIPFAAAWFALIFTLTGKPQLTFSSGYFAWLSLGAISQIVGTALMLKAMQGENFTLVTAYVKTEILQVAVFGLVFLGEPLGIPTIFAVAIGTTAVLTLSFTHQDRHTVISKLISPGTMYGVASGAAFALSTVGFKGATIALSSNYLSAAALTVVLAQLLQTLFMSTHFAIYQKGLMTRILKNWKHSIFVGTSGACASIGWFTAMAIEPIAHVRTFALIEVLMSYVVSRRFFRERLTPIQFLAVISLTLSVAMVTMHSASD